MAVAYLMEIPLADGHNCLLVEVDAMDLPDDIVPASPEPGKVIARAGKTLEAALAEIEPAIKAMADWVRRVAPQEFALEFGLKLGGRTCVIVASGTAEVNFVVKLTWRP